MKMLFSSVYDLRAGGDGSGVPVLSCYSTCSRSGRTLPRCHPGDRSIATPTSLSCPLCPLRNPRPQNLRFLPVDGFEAICLYCLVNSDTIPVIRILHSKRDLRRILEREGLERW